MKPTANFEEWARQKGMLLDRDENGKYKSLETRAYADTWKDAQSVLLTALQGIVKETSFSRMKLNINRDFSFYAAHAQCLTAIYNAQEYKEAR